ncbi:MAG TPA: Wzz/FepE/Etk N-terminal domain-containing protein [Symbiobacteriaceae bacterium]|nr:Wzz/FepE/Etk N-terminal domain-containing protein [Symbiobacteriaceae bacterium]
MMEQNELDLREVFRVLQRRWWMIVALPLVAGLTAGILSLYVLNPVYSASTTLWVIKEGSGQISYNDLMLNRNLTKTYAEVAKSRAVMADAIERLGQEGKITVVEVQKKLTVTPVRDTEILSFTIEDENPAMAAKWADAVAEAFKDQIRTYMKVENVVVVDPATVPVSPIKPRPMMNTAVAVVLGLMAAVGIAFLLEYLDTSIKTPEDVTRHAGLPVLGIIPVIDMSVEDSPAQRQHRRRSTAKKPGEGVGA